MAGQDERTSDLGEIFDIDRKRLTAQFVDNMQQCMLEAQVARDNLRAFIASAREQQFTRNEIAAMRSIAKLRLDDKQSAARDKLEALQRVGHAVGIDLFTWQSQ